MPPLPRVLQKPPGDRPQGVTGLHGIDLRVIGPQRDRLVQRHRPHPLADGPIGGEGCADVLAAPILDLLGSGTRLVSFERGEMLFWQDEPSPGLHIIQKGAIKLFKLAPNGRELVINIFKDGASFSEVPVFDGGPAPVNAAALEPSQVWIVDAAVIRRVLPAALDRYASVYLLTHVPPLREACWYNGAIPNDEWAPPFTCKAVGDAILEIMPDYPHRELTVLCGHTHGSGEAHPLPNVWIFTGAAVYGFPAVNRVLTTG